MIPLGRRNDPPRRLGVGTARGTTSLVGKGPGSLPPMNSPQNYDEEYTLRLIPSIKKYNIARFNDGEMPTLSKCIQPIHMFKEAEKVVEDDEEKKEEPQGWNPALRKKRRRRRKDTRMKNWVIQEDNSKMLYTGTVEGGVTSAYMLMIKVPNKNEFQVFPVEDWFRFKKPLNYRTLTLEEAEEMNNEKKRAVERWIMKIEKKDGEVASTTSMVTGALRTVKSEDKDEGNDFFAEVKAPRRRGPIAKKSAEVDATGDDGGDFTEIFSDDEGQQEVEKVKDDMASESSGDEYEDGASKKALTDEGKALQDLVKRTKEQSENPTSESQNAEKDDSDDEEKAPASSDNTVKKYDFYGNPIIVKEVPVAAVDEGNANPATQSEPDTLKRPREREEEKSNKRATPAPKGSTAPKLTEALLQEELIRYGGRMKTRDLLKKLKKLLVTADDKAMFKDIVRTICDVEEDPIDGRYMDFLAGDERIQCIFNQDAPACGFMDPSTEGNDIPMNTKLELPLWLGKELSSILQVQVPTCLSARYRNVVKAGPASANLRDMNPYFFELGNSVLSLIDNESDKLEVDEILRVAAGGERYKQILDQSMNSHNEDTTEFTRKLTEFEKDIFQAGVHDAQNFLSWQNRRSQLITSSKVVQIKKRKRMNA